jgi:hypothetical protein
MPTRLWLSGRCFECHVERIAPAGDGWVVKTRARRYFRFDTASVALLRKVMALDAPDLDDPSSAQAAAFVEHRLIPLGIYCGVDDAAATEAAHTTTGTMRWQRPLLAARQVRPVAAALATMFSPWVLLPLLALCLWLHASHALNGSSRLVYHDLLSYTPNELMLLVVVAAGRRLDALDAALKTPTGQPEPCLHGSAPAGKPHRPRGLVQRGASIRAGARRAGGSHA